MQKVASSKRVLRHQVFVSCNSNYCYAPICLTNQSSKQCLILEAKPSVEVEQGAVLINTANFKLLNCSHVQLTPISNVVDQGISTIYFSILNNFSKLSHISNFLATSHQQSLFPKHFTSASDWFSQYLSTFLLNRVISKDCLIIVNVLGEDVTVQISNIESSCINNCDCFLITKQVKCTLYNAPVANIQSNEIDIQNIKHAVAGVDKQASSILDLMSKFLT